jgi:hypothetical protein
MSEGRGLSGGAHLSKRPIQEGPTLENNPSKGAHHNSRAIQEGRTLMITVPSRRGHLRFKPCKRGPCT